MEVNLVEHAVKHAVKIRARMVVSRRDGVG